MTYLQFRDLIQAKLRERRRGMTWRELRDDLGLPYDRPCPEWTRRLESDIGLIRQKRTGNAFVWLCGSRSNEGGANIRDCI
jgi:hypothetical protein